MVFFDGALDGGAFLLPVRHQFVDALRIHYRAGNDVGADLLSLFENGDRKILVQFSKLICGCETGGTSTDDDNVEIKRFSFGHNYRISKTRNVCNPRLISLRIF